MGVDKALSNVGGQVRVEPPAAEAELPIRFLDESLDHLPRIEAVRDQVDDDLRAWVAEARRRELSWDRIGAALGMKRQSAWERFAG